MIDKIISDFGGTVMLAKALNVSPPAVSRWLITNEVPPKRAIQIEVLSKGKFKAVDIIKGDVNDD